MTGAMGFAATGAPLLSPGLALTTLGVFGTSACANALNQLREIDRDGRMARTKNRPLPSGRCGPEAAAVFATAAGGGGAACLATLDPFAAALAVGNIALYAGAYTSMKPRSEWNTWVGAVVGAAPPLIGWAAAGGSLWGPNDAAHAAALAAADFGTPAAALAAELAATPAEPYLLAGALYLWQFPHFFALAWVHKTDYARGGYAMVPVRDPTGLRTSGLVARYAAYSSLFPFAAVAAGAAGPMFAVEGCALNAALAYAAYVRRADSFSDGSRRRRGRDGDIPWAVTPRPRRGYSVAVSRGGAAAATGIFRGRGRRGRDGDSPGR